MPKKAGLTRSQLGRIVDAYDDRASLYLEENIVCPSITTLEKLASALHTNPAYLVGWSDNPKPIEEKYTVQVFPDDHGYLNWDEDDRTFCIDNSCESEAYQPHFTQAEINEFKQYKDIAIDWDKAIIKPVEGNDD